VALQDLVKNRTSRSTLQYYAWYSPLEDVAVQGLMKYRTSRSTGCIALCLTYSRGDVAVQDLVKYRTSRSTIQYHVWHSPVWDVAVQGLMKYRTSRSTVLYYAWYCPQKMWQYRTWWSLGPRGVMVVACCSPESICQHRTEIERCLCSKKDLRMLQSDRTGVPLCGVAVLSGCWPLQ
jgi:hypothetical protein